MVVDHRNSHTANAQKGVWSNPKRLSQIDQSPKLRATNTKPNRSRVNSSVCSRSCSNELAPWANSPTDKTFAEGIGSAPWYSSPCIRTDRTSSCAGTERVSCRCNSQPTFPCSHPPFWIAAGKRFRKWVKKFCYNHDPERNKWDLNLLTRKLLLRCSETTYLAMSLDIIYPGPLA